MRRQIGESQILFFGEIPECDGLGLGYLTVTTTMVGRLCPVMVVVTDTLALPPPKQAAHFRP